MTHHAIPDRTETDQLMLVWHMIDEIDLIGMVVDHAGLARLCADLEVIADRLPDPPGEAQATRLHKELMQRLPALDARERALTKRLCETTKKRPVGIALLRQVESRRAACVVQGQDVASALLPGPSPHTPETLGYMLRCFFETCRQAMAFEELVILHLSSRRLTRDARTLLTRSLARRCAD